MKKRESVFRRALAAYRSKAMLAIGGTMSGRQLPVWNVDVPARWKLRHVLMSWAMAVLRLGEVGVKRMTPSAHVIGKFGGPSLDLNATLMSLKPQLAIKSGRFCLTVSWPAIFDRPLVPAGKKAAKDPSSVVRTGLNKLSVSSRYTLVDKSGTRSSTMQGKIQSGYYGKVGAHGVELPHGHGELLKACPSSGLCSNEEVWPGPLGTVELVVFTPSSERSGDAPQQQLFRTRLVGPESQLANWRATVRRFQKQRDLAAPPDEDLRGRPFPVFILSSGRAQRAHLNWEAPHAFGQPPRSGGMPRWPVLCVVVEPREEEAYREVWPRALMLVLPENGQGPSYARWVVQLTCTKGFEWKPGVRRGKQEGICGQPKVLPWCWICDDNLLAFFRLVGVATATHSNRAAVCKRREWEDIDGSTPLFWEAMVAVQRHPSLLSVAVAGFLRDDGTAACKKKDWKSDELSIYKVVLLNLRELKRLGAEYLPSLQLFEDIYLNAEVRRRGGQTLKCQGYCFRAALFGQGGCEEQRRQARDRQGGSTLANLLDLQAYSQLDAERKAGVLQLLQWLQLREGQSLRKQQQRKSGEEGRLGAGGPPKGAGAAGPRPRSGSCSSSSSSSSSDESMRSQSVARG